MRQSLTLITNAKQFPVYFQIKLIPHSVYRLCDCGQHGQGQGQSHWQPSQGPSKLPLLLPHSHPPSPATYNSKFWNHIHGCGFRIPIPLDKLSLAARLSSRSSSRHLRTLRKARTENLLSALVYHLPSIGGLSDYNDWWINFNLACPEMWPTRFFLSG